MHQTIIIMRFLCCLIKTGVSHVSFDNSFLKNSHILTVYLFRCITSLSAYHHMKVDMIWSVKLRHLAGNQSSRVSVGGWDVWKQTRELAGRCQIWICTYLKCVKEYIYLYMHIYRNPDCYLWLTNETNVAKKCLCIIFGWRQRFLWFCGFPPSLSCCSDCPIQPNAALIFSLY